MLSLDRIKNMNDFASIVCMEVHEPAIKTISHEKMSIMIVLMAVASIESVFSPQPLQG